MSEIQNMKSKQTRTSLKEGTQPPCGGIPRRQQSLRSCLPSSRGTASSAVKPASPSWLFTLAWPVSHTLPSSLLPFKSVTSKLLWLRKVGKSPSWHDTLSRIRCKPRFRGCPVDEVRAPWCARTQLLLCALFCFFFGHSNAGHLTRVLRVPRPGVFS